MGPGQQPTDQRIGVIGAGASGLSAAHYLRRAGYGNVTVLERAQQVGGKCCSVTVGQHVYELGAVLATRNYDTTLELMESVGVEAAPTFSVHCFDPDGHPIDLFPRSQIPRLLWQVLLRYAWATQVRYRRINQPGLVGIDPDLYEPFARFAGQHALPTLSEALALPFTGFGYGYFDEIPTAYVMKYLDLHTIESVISPRRRMIWPDGVQSLWARLAQELDVRTGVAIRSITRQGSVLVQTDQGPWEFDTLIMTSPLDEALAFLDASATERRLFSAIRTYNYWVLLCSIDDMPDQSGYLPTNFVAERGGHVMMWYHRWPGQPLYALYVLDDGTRSHEQIERTCAEDVARLGGRLEQVVDTRCWKYFPHVGPEDMAAGYYETLEALQGTQNTYYAGEIMSFSTIELCAQYSRSLVERFFSEQSNRAGLPA